MERAYFISDAHLGADKKEIEKIKEERLLAFFNAIQDQADYLYIVGDFFEFWFEYRQVVPKCNLRILAKLLQLAEAGVTVRYLAGNHDLWLGSFLEREIGIAIYHEPLEAVHNDLKLYIAHGDGLTSGDAKYKILKRIFKNPVNICLYRMLHPDIGIPLAKFVSRRSRTKGENKFATDFRNFAVAKFKQGYDGVILGHTHRAIFEIIDDSYYVNLGDWMRRFTYLELNGVHFQLNSWNHGP
ncbi:MAG: UDP-2,3-diacylglucosamine diphosphatase [bacterium]